MWLCRDDLVNMYIQALQDDSFSGVYNATAPNPVRMSELCSSLGGQLGRPSWLPVPDFALQVNTLHTSFSVPIDESVEQCVFGGELKLVTLTSAACIFL